jgi:hypothetical protein
MEAYKKLVEVSGEGLAFTTPRIVSRRNSVSLLLKGRICAGV